MREDKSDLYYEELVLSNRTIKAEDKDRINSILQSNKEILEEYNSKEFAKSVFQSIKRERSRKRSYLSIAAAVIFTVIVGLNWNTDTTRLKGGNSYLTLYKRHLDENIVVKDGDSFKEGESIQITYINKKWEFGTIISKDSKGVVTLHYPGEINDSGFLIKKVEAILPYSYEFDGTPGEEIFYFLGSDKSIHIKEAMNLVKVNDFKGLEKKGLQIIDQISISKE